MFDSRPDVWIGKSLTSYQSVLTMPLAMIQRYDLLAVDLPVPESPNPAAAAAVQELMGGKFGEMSTLMNYTFQSFNFRGKAKHRPFYDLICNIATEEYSHIEAVAAAINLLLTGATPRVDRNKPTGKKADSVAKQATDQVTSGSSDPAPLSEMLGAPYPYHFIASSGGHAIRFYGQSLERQLRNGYGQPENGPVAQLFPGVRSSCKQDARL